VPRRPPPNQRPRLAGKARAAKKISIAQWDALLARYPVGAPLDRISQAASVVGANAFVLHLLWSGKVQPVELVLLVLVEGLLLAGIAHLQMLFVPRTALMEKPQPLRAKLAVALFGLVWLAGVYGIFLGGVLGNGAQLLAALRDPWAALQRSGLAWPLAIALVGAGIDSTRDWMHWRSRGGYFLSTPGFHAGARWLTLFLGGIPFVLPFFAAVIGLTTLVKRVGERLSRVAATPSDKRFRALLPWVVPLGAMAIFYGATFLVQEIQRTFVTGMELWALGYCAAKLASEAFITFLPWIASRARTDEVRELGEEPASSSG